MFSRSLTLAMLGLPLLFGGCVPSKPPNADYAKRAYLKQQEEISSPSSFPIEDRVSKATLHFDSDSRSQWEKQSYETLDSWIERLKNSLEGNDKLLQAQKTVFDSLVKEEATISERIRELLTSNNSMIATLQNSLIKENKNLNTTKLTPPFSIYLVQKGDTLYSISQKFYKTSSAIVDIMDWNRGWIRYPSQIQTGTPLVLYHSLSTKKGNLQVFNFIHLLDELREEELALTETK